MAVGSRREGMRHQFAVEVEMAKFHDITDERSVASTVRLPALQSLLVIGALSALSWAVIIAAVEELSTLL